MRRIFVMLLILTATFAGLIYELQAPSHLAADTPRSRAIDGRSVRALPSPPTTTSCEKSSGQACYSPLQIETAYDLKPLYKAGLNGKGITIAIVDSFGSPTIARDLSRFDSDFNLPAPPSFKIITPSGKIPRFNPRGTDRIGWASETTLDVEYAHAIAPGANILLVETPVDETLGTVGFPQIVHAENYVINNGMAQVISQSFGAAEETFPNKQSILNLRGAYKNANAHDVTVLAATGDFGPTSPRDVQNDLYPYRVADWPASDPLVTAVGGTQLHLNSIGIRKRPDNVWNDTTPAGVEASSGGISTVFARPNYQAAVKNIATTGRGFPDISMSAATNGGVLIYASFPGISSGYHSIGGTSESSPLFAGIVAIADQATGHRLGLLNPALYRLGSGSPGIPDVTLGNTTVRFRSGGKRITVQGYQAVKGYDLATGLGTVDAAKLIPELSGKPL